jgi:SSS family solute:Na+ symporter
VGIKGGWLAGDAAQVWHLYPSEMAQNFWTAIYAWSVCFVATILISLATRSTKTDEELTGLVYSLTPRVHEQGLPWWKRPATLGVIVLGATLLLNWIFW